MPCQFSHTAAGALCDSADLIGLCSNGVRCGMIHVVHGAKIRHTLFKVADNAVVEYRDIANGRTGLSHHIPWCFHSAIPVEGAERQQFESILSNVLYGIINCVTKHSGVVEDQGMLDRTGIQSQTIDGLITQGSHRD